MALLCWSGGCDSTLILYKLLKAGNKNVRTISINHHQIPAKFQNKTSRMMILRKLAKQGLKVKEHTELNINYDCGGNVSYHNMAQSSIWQFNAMVYLGEKENLYLGYIKPDCIWHYRTELYNLFGNVCRITGRTGKLETPLEWYTKEDVIKELANVGLENLVWWCESPNGEHDFKPCGKCVPCKTVSAAKNDFKKSKQLDVFEGITDLLDQPSEEKAKEVTEKPLTLGPHNCKKELSNS